MEHTMGDGNMSMLPLIPGNIDVSIAIETDRTQIKGGEEDEEEEIFEKLTAPDKWWNNPIV